MSNSIKTGRGLVEIIDKALVNLGTTVIARAKAVS